MDSREQDTLKYHQRLARFSCPILRTKLDLGDYSAQVTLPSGGTFSLGEKISVERKMSIDECASCWTTSRDRFKREFERVRAKNAKVYLLIDES